MGWETRGNRRYFYTKRKIKGRVVSEYQGTDYGALLSEILTERARLEATQKRLEWEAIQNEEARLDKMVNDFTTLAEAYTKAVMLLTGHHQHKRQWRRSRNGDHSTPAG